MDSVKDGVPDEAMLCVDEEVGYDRDEPHDEVDSLDLHVHVKLVIQRRGQLWLCEQLVGGRLNLLGRHVLLAKLEVKVEVGSEVHYDRDVEHEVVADRVIVDDEAEQVRGRREVVHVLEVQHDRETESCEVCHACVVHEVLACVESGFSDHPLEVVEPEEAPEDLRHVEGVEVEALEGAVEAGLGHTVDLEGYERELPIKLLIDLKRPP